MYGTMKAHSRVMKKQIGGFVEEGMWQDYRRYAKLHNLSSQEMIALSVNLAVAALGRDAILQVSRERIIFRLKSPAQATKEGPTCRLGKKRIAGHFHTPDVERLQAFSKEKGKSIQNLFSTGLSRLLKAPPVIAAVDAAETSAAADLEMAA